METRKESHGTGTARALPRQRVLQKATEINSEKTAAEEDLAMRRKRVEGGSPNTVGTGMATHGKHCLYQRFT